MRYREIEIMQFIREEEEDLGQAKELFSPLKCKTTPGKTRFIFFKTHRVKKM